MAVYNTSSDASNTATRAFLTKVGEYYWGRSFNTSSGHGKKTWEHIREKVFNHKCAYCGVEAQKLQIEHLIMFNREQFGLHHPGNIVPCCNSCNKRRKDANNNYLSWEKQLESICDKNKDLNSYFRRRDLILKHINEGEYRYPQLNEAEQKTIQVIATSLYQNIKQESEKALALYEELDRVFVKK